ncbi:MAG: hypothetical protein GEU80_13485 [Dehalococcoidia bacterium]|nr:hypothetical protein [Dehalococcoidia bacterium]
MVTKHTLRSRAAREPGAVNTKVTLGHALPSLLALYLAATAIALGLALGLDGPMAAAEATDAAGAVLRWCRIG